MPSYYNVNAPFPSISALSALLEVAGLNESSTVSNGTTVHVIMTTPNGLTGIATTATATTWTSAARLLSSETPTLMGDGSLRETALVEGWIDTAASTLVPILQTEKQDPVWKQGLLQFVDKLEKHLFTSDLTYLVGNAPTAADLLVALWLAEACVKLDVKELPQQTFRWCMTLCHHSTLQKYAPSSLPKEGKASPMEKGTTMTPTKIAAPPAPSESAAVRVSSGGSSAVVKSTEGAPKASQATSDVDLAKLKEVILAMGEKIKKLKSEGADKDAIGPVLDEMLAAKKKYADNNNGIGHDGKPYQEPMTKAQKKAKAKAEKGAGPAKPQADPNSKGQQKKTEKKAAAKAKKEAMKKGEIPTPSGTENAPLASATSPPAGGAKNFKAPRPAMNLPARMNPKIQPMQIVINPNLPLSDRPMVALTVAVMNNTILDYSLVSDHMSRHTALGLPDNGGILVGDLAMARYILQRSGYISSPMADSWVDYAQSIWQLDIADKVSAIAMTLEHTLGGNARTYLVGHSLSLADIAVFGALGFPSEYAGKMKIMEALPDEAKAAKRWIQMMAAWPAIREATQLAVGIVNNAEAVFDDSPVLEPLVEGMDTLQGAVPGAVVTRFPPEPSGYLHIGHGKACLLNDYYARRYRGRLIVRFDDTNPSKEKEEFQSSIVEDLGKLGIKPDMITFTSDYFETIKSYAEFMLKNGLAFMDDTPQEQMKTERMERKDSKHRSQTPDEAMKLFKEMCSGSVEGGKWCMRAKIDMSSVNGTMRDPVLFRQNLTPHHRSGTQHKAYPTYDLACPIVDSLEGVTHALRTTEYNDRDEQYQWIQAALKLRRVRIHAFARVNFNYTVMSKRKLTWFVESGNVTGWDDPRFPTVRGVVRRGINIAALRNFMYAQGASRRVVNMEWSKFWAENKKEIDKTAKRFMAIDKESHVKLTITNGPETSENAFLTTDYHPKDPSLGKRVVRVSKEVLLETVDTEGMQVGEDIVLVRWGVMKLTKVGDDGLEAEYIPDGNFKAAKRKISWIANVPNNTKVVLFEFDNLVLKEKLEEEDNFKDFINPHTKAETEVIGDAALKLLQHNDIIQLERRGYYRVDRPHMSDDKPLHLFMVPDGKKKAMSDLAGKLAHR